jgi:hypothetical protein
MTVSRTVALTFAAVVVLHQPASASVSDALDAVLDAADINDGTDSRCQAKLGGKLDAAIDSLRSAKKNPTDRAISGAKRKIKAAADTAEDRCPDRVGGPVVAKLDAALDALDEAVDNGDGGGGGGGDGGGVIRVKVANINVGNGTWDGRPTVELNPKGITLKGARGRNIFFAVGIRPKNSDTLEWSTLAAEQVVYDPAEWKDGGVFRFYNDWLTEHDTANGNWVAVFVIYDNDTREELGRKETSFTFGSTEDPVMDADTYDAFLAQLGDSRTDFNRLDIVKSFVASSKINAKQLGPVLDSFTNELLRLDAAKAALPRVTNPSAALVHANKFRNSLLADEYRGLCQ